jgi:leucyl/phenylalanyl-tRNA---protein transferase
MRASVFRIVWAVQPQRFDWLVQIGRLWRRRLFGTEPALADLPKQPGAGEILGIADDLSVPTLVQAYQAGLFPHSHIGTPKWLSPTQRCVLFFQDLHISKRLKRLMRQGRYTVTFDQASKGDQGLCRQAGRALPHHLDHAADHARLR